MAAIPTALPTGPAPPAAKKATAPPKANATEETTTTTITKEVNGCNVKFTEETKPPAKQTITAGKEMVRFDPNGQPNNGNGNHMKMQPNNQSQQNYPNPWSNQNYNPFSNGCQTMGGNMFNPFNSPYGQWNYNNNNAMYNQQLSNTQGSNNQVFKPAPSMEEQRQEYVTILMKEFKSGKEIDPGRAASMTALSNVFSAKSTTTTTSSNKEAWYQGNKPAIKAWSGYNPDILSMNNGLWDVICSSAHKETKKEAVENQLFAALIAEDGYFERGICNEELIDTIVELKFKPANLVASKHHKGLGVAAMFEQGAETVEQLKQRSERLKSGNMTVIDDKYIGNMQLTTGKRPVGEEQTAKTISLGHKLIGKLFSLWSPLSQWLDAVHGATVALGTRTRDMTARDWQTNFGDGILAGVHEGTVNFFGQKYTKRQVDCGMAIDMTYQHNFLNGLRAGIVVVPQLRPPLFKQGLT